MYVYANILYIVLPKGNCGESTLSDLVSQNNQPEMNLRSTMFNILASQWCANPTVTRESILSEVRPLRVKLVRETMAAAGKESCATVTHSEDFEDKVVCLRGEK